MIEIQNELQKRSNATCELCGGAENLNAYEIKPSLNKGIDGYALLCNHCQAQIDKITEIDINHWQCLRDSMWNTNIGVQVLAYRMLTILKNEDWAMDLINMMYLDEEVLQWAQANEPNDAEANIQHKDANGVTLSAGDTVTLIKDLNVKGASFTAKRGTAVRNISLVYDNPEQIEGRVNGQQIVILTQFVKK